MPTRQYYILDRCKNDIVKAKDGGALLSLEVTILLLPPVPKKLIEKLKKLTQGLLESAAMPHYRQSLCREPRKL